MPGGEILDIFFILILLSVFLLISFDLPEGQKCFNFAGSDVGIIFLSSSLGHLCGASWKDVLPWLGFRIHHTAAELAKQCNKQGGPSLPGLEKSGLNALLKFKRCNACAYQCSRPYQCFLGC